jgi:hypothetical protein
MEQITPKTPFQSWIDEVPTAKFPTIRNRIISECKITRGNFSHWRLGKTNPSPLAQEKINAIAGKEIFKLEAV